MTEKNNTPAYTTAANNRTLSGVSVKSNSSPTPILSSVSFIKANNLKQNYINFLRSPIDALCKG